jgi:hypothetical protein
VLWKLFKGSCGICSMLIYDDLLISNSYLSHLSILTCKMKSAVSEYDEKVIEVLIAGFEFETQKS